MRFAIGAGAYRFFRVRVTRIADITPSFRRFTFGGEDLDQYGDPGFDQRVKIVFPTSEQTLDAMPRGNDWYARWRMLPEERRLPFRTYTTRAVRHAAREVDIDMVAHDVLGPASDWVARADVGDEVLILAPTTPLRAVSLGIGFLPPADTSQHLLVGDETAAPAIAVILEQLPPEARGVVVAELPDEADDVYLPRHPGFRYAVASRGSDARGAHLLSAATAAATELVHEARSGKVKEIDVDTDIVWEVPRTRRGGAVLKRAPLYAWLAGEAGAITTLRRRLVAELGIDRRAVAFMGYWRLDRAEN